MDIETPIRKSKTEIIHSGLFKDNDRVLCEFVDSRECSNWSLHKDPFKHAVNNTDLIEDAVNLIVHCPRNTLVKQIKNDNILSNIDWSDKASAKNILIKCVKDRWEDIDGFELNYLALDHILSAFTIKVSLETEYGEIKNLSGDIIEKWDYTIFTQYGEFDV